MDVGTGHTGRDRVVRVAGEGGVDRAVAGRGRSGHLHGEPRLARIESASIAQQPGTDARRRPVWPRGEARANPSARRRRLFAGLLVACVALLALPLQAYAQRAADDCTADTSTTCTITLGGSTAGELETDPDVDWFSVSLDQDVPYKVYLEPGLAAGGSLDPQILGIYNSSGTLISGTSDTDTGADFDSFVVFEHDGAGAATFYVAVSHQDSFLGTYSLWVTQEQPGADASEPSGQDLPPHAGTSGHVTASGTVTGNIQTLADVTNRDLDHFGVVMQGGSAYQIDVKGACASNPGEAGGTLTAPEVSLRRVDASRGFAGLATHLNPPSQSEPDQFFGASSGVCNNKVMLVEALVDGNYFIRVAGQSLSDTGTYTLKVTPPPANAEPRFTSASAVSVDENTKGNNTKFSYTVSAVDDDPMDTVTLALTGGAHQSDFTFDPANGELSAKAKFDHESLPANADGEVILTVEFTATSGIGSRERTATQTLNITVNDVPELPRPVQGPNTTTRVGSNFIEIFWQVNERNRPANLHYEIEYRVSGTTAWTAWPNVFTTLVGRVTGLMPETMYQLQVRAVNDDGPGGWFGPVTGETDIPDSNDCAADATTACSVTVGSSARSTLLAYEDVDWFSVDLDAGVHYSVYMGPGGVGSEWLGDSEIKGIYNSESALIMGTGDQDSGQGVDSFITFVPDASGSHFVAATAKDKTLRSGLYDIWVAVQTPTASVSEGSVDLPDNAGTRGHVLVGGTATGTIGSDAIELTLSAWSLNRTRPTGSR